MNAEEASLALGTMLNYVSGRPGDEIYLALPHVKGSALARRRRPSHLSGRIRAILTSKVCLSGDQFYQLH
jgi:hypothetical protein